MSLASSPDCFWRPEDKALQMLFPTAEPSVPNSFDEFFNKEQYAGSTYEDTKDAEDEAVGCLTQADIATFPTNGLTSNHANASQSKQFPPQPWRKGLWCLNQKLEACLRIGKTRKAPNAPPSDISPAFLVVEDNSAAKSPNPSDQCERTKNVNPSRLHEQRTSRGMDQSPNLMYSQPFLESNNEFVNTWQQDFQNFNLHASDEQVDRFPTHYAPYEDLKHNPTLAHRAGMESVRAATIHNMSWEVGYGRNDGSFAPTQQFSNIMNNNVSATSHNMFSSTPNQNDTAFRFITEDLPGMSDWTSNESMHSSNSSHNSHFSQGSFENHKQSTYHTSLPSTGWSPSKAAFQSQVNPTLEEHFPALVQPKPRRATHQVLRYNYGGDDGSGVEYSSSEEVGIAVPYYPPDFQQSVMSCAQSTFQNGAPGYMNALASYPPLPPPAQSFPDESPFTTPQRRNRAPSRTPSPPMSPSHRSSRSLRQRSPSRREPSQHRRKSMHRPGPIKDGADAPRHRSLSRPPRTPKTPKTPSDGFAVGFVNFTPKDAAKLLNDVAPSGSSKTRARREQEAREKRKKLSEAAIIAVRNAGGDVAALQRAILT